MSYKQLIENEIKILSEKLQQLTKEVEEQRHQAKNINLDGKAYINYKRKLNTLELTQNRILYLVKIYQSLFGRSKRVFYLNCIDRPIECD